MKLSISNIAWTKPHDAEVYALLKQHGYTAIDIAPSRVWDDVASVTTADTDAFLRVLEPHGLVVSGLQSLLFNRPELVLFGDREARAGMVKVLEHMIDIASMLGARPLVFGSPKNRIIGEVTPEKERIAAETFAHLGAYAHDRGTVFCLEANPTIYGGDYLTHTKDVCELVRTINVPGLGVNLDMGTVYQNEERDIDALIGEYLPHIHHVQVSMPYLKPIERMPLHDIVLSSLVRCGYTGWVAIEMASLPDETLMKDLPTMLQNVAELFARVTEKEGMV